MCGPFTRELRPGPNLYVQQLQQQQQQAEARRLAEAAAGNCPTQQFCQLPEFVSSTNFTVPEDVKKVDLEPLPAQADDVFNWDLFDDQFGGLETAFGFGDIPEGAKHTAQEPVPKFDFSLSVPPAAPAAAPSVVPSKPAKKNKRAKMPKKEKRSTSLEAFESDVKSEDLSEDAALDEEMRQGTPYSEKLPKDLLDHPCAATLLSAGIRIKGRTRDELIEVAERIKKRRRASAARCRARKATHISLLEEENHHLKDENIMLKQRIAELTGGNFDLSSFFGQGPQSQHQPCGMSGIQVAQMPMAF